MTMYKKYINRNIIKNDMDIINTHINFKDTIYDLEKDSSFDGLLVDILKSINNMLMNNDNYIVGYNDNNKEFNNQDNIYKFIKGLNHYSFLKELIIGPYSYDIKILIDSKIIKINLKYIQEKYYLNDLGIYKTIKNNNIKKNNYNNKDKVLYARFDLSNVYDINKLKYKNYSNDFIQNLILKEFIFD